MKLPFGIRLMEQGAFLAPASVSAGRWQPSEQTVRNYGGYDRALAQVVECCWMAMLDVVRILNEMRPQRNAGVFTRNDDGYRRKSEWSETDEAYRSRVERWLVEPDEVRDRWITARLERLKETLEGARCFRVPKR